jgi:Fe2+ transport system protein B
MGPWGGKPRKFPTRWLTYNQRIDADLDDAFTDPGAKEFFDNNYMASLVAPIKQQEDWILKLVGIQFTIVLFLVVGFASKDVTVNFFGIALGNVPGIKEVLLGISATVALFIAMLTSARDTTLCLVESISKRTTNKTFAAYEKFALPSHFNFRLYLPREYNRWIFAKKPTKVVTVTIALLSLFLMIAFIVAATAIQVVFIREIWKHPTIGFWSYFSLAYILAAYFLHLLIFLRRSVPFPYEDKSMLKTR